MNAPFIDGFDIKLHTAWITDEKNKKKKIRTDAVFRIAFKDNLTGETIAEIILTPATAKNLSIGLSRSIEKLIKGELKKKPVVKDHQGYIG
ncbi:MAG: hypothetical protein ACE5FW_03445 [Candidatus Aenigmatarchaeota archaeon]